METTREDLDAALVSILGMTWAEIAAEHDMKCGRCKGGMLRLQTVNISERFSPFERVKVKKDGWRTEIVMTPLAQSVTVDLCCEDCGLKFAMPLHAREEQTP